MKYMQQDVYTKHFAMLDNIEISGGKTRSRCKAEPVI